jgi:hypothetical protein
MCRFRGELLHLADALMQLSRDELFELEVELEDGSIIRPARFNEPNPEIRRDADGILAF